MSAAATSTINAKADLPYAADRSVRGIAPISAAVTLNPLDSGRTFVVSKAAAYTITLPAVQAGLQFTFIGGAVAANAVVIASANAGVMAGTWRQISGAATVTAASNSISFTATSVLGDEIRVHCDGTNWYVKGDTGVAAGMQFLP